MSDDGKVVFVPHPYNCNKFFMCQFASPILMACPAGLHFDATLHVCNYPEEAHCVPTPRPTTSTSTTTEDPTTTESDPETTTEEEEEPTTPAALLWS
jgi:hypothetical protein